MLFYPTGILHFHFFGCHFGPRLLSLWQKCDPDRCDQNSHKNRLCFFTQQTFLFSFLWLSLGDPTLILVAKVWSWQARQKSHKSRLCFFLPNRHFPCSYLWLSFEVATWVIVRKAWSSQVRSKFIYKSFMFVFTQQTFSIFIPSAVAWGPSSGLCCKSVILTSAIKIRIKVVYVFYPTSIAHFHSFRYHLGSQLGALLQKCDPGKCN